MHEPRATRHPPPGSEQQHNTALTIYCTCLLAIAAHRRHPGKPKTWHPRRLEAETLATSFVPEEEEGISSTSGATVEEGGWVTSAGSSIAIVCGLYEVSPDKEEYAETVYPRAYAVVVVAGEVAAVKG